MSQPRATTLAIFCKVVDNFGDIGICWRLARQLQREHGVAVTLWVDDLASFRRLCPAVDVAADHQLVEAIAVRHWRDQEGQFGPADIADIVIEFFACDIPPAYIEAMAQCTPRPVWLNLEGLTAETWVEGCHTLPSMHPRLKLTKHFFFPGFTAKTGGLLRETALSAERARWDADRDARAAFLRTLGLTQAELAATKVSLFCYPDAPVEALFGAWEQGAEALVCLVPQGVALASVARFLGQPAEPGAVHTRGALTVRVIPFVAQPDYDRLLWSCDLNFVRGEDSFVRAQWASAPFIWHIYVQDDNLHHTKLRAFLDRYDAPQASLAALALRWNSAPGTGELAGADWATLWRQFRADLPGLRQHAAAWQVAMREHGDLASNLLAFAATLQGVAPENSGIMRG
jgi:uncharacterized repeat protein (TIGR03837 family)